MAAASSTGLLLKFRRRHTQFGVTRETVKAMAERFDVSETEVVHMALARMAREELPAYEADVAWSQCEPAASLGPRGRGARAHDAEGADDSATAYRRLRSQALHQCRYEADSPSIEGLLCGHGDAQQRHRAQALLAARRATEPGGTASN